MPPNFSFGASADPSQPAPTSTPQNPMQLLAQFLPSLFGGGQGQGGGGAAAQPFDIAGLLQQLHQVKDPQGFADRSYVPGVQNAYNPFDNGFFKNTAAAPQVAQQQPQPQAIASSVATPAMGGSPAQPKKKPATQPLGSPSPNPFSFSVSN